MGILFAGAFCVLNFQLRVSHLLERVEALSSHGKKVAMNSKLLEDLPEKDEMQLRKVMYHLNSCFQLLKISETNDAVANPGCCPQVKDCFGMNF